MAEVTQKIVSCPKGHFYNSYEFDYCPVCASFGGSSSQAKTSAAEPQVGGGQAFEETIMPDLDPSLDPADVFAGFAGSGGMNTGNFDRTVAPVSRSADGDRYAGASTYFNSSDNPFSHTEAVQSYGGKGEFAHTIAVDDTTPKGMPAPVVGWLVAIDGPCRGNDYRIHSNYNYIGREVGDIIIYGDQTISAKRDCSIAYVISNKRFYIAHEQGLNTVLVNGEPVMGAAHEIKTFDVITVGNTKLLFVALCGDKFDWSNGPKQDLNV